jgi:para-nitrobenzyl esterase
MSRTVFSASDAAMAMEATAIAHTALGDLRGLRGEGYASFRAVPYAAPPVGASRFAPPQPAPSWTGLRDATRHGPIAPQGRSRLAAAMGDFARPQDEDCLTLTISTPAADDGARPVMVFLHGGAYSSGAGSLDWYDGAVLARDQGIVVVGVNYRLGALGWLVHEGVSEGNLGLQDQVAALRWVRDQIVAFGGDPAQVTVAGQSAGAGSIVRLLTEADAKALFRRAILQSGGFSRPPATREVAAKTGAEFVRLLGEDPRTAPTERLIEAQGEFARGRARFAETTPPFVPVSDAPNRPDAAAGLDVMIGVTREEMHAFFAANPEMQDPPPDAVAAKFAELRADKERYRVRRPGGSAMDLIADLMSEHVFIRPTFQAAGRMAAAGAQVFAYRFDWAPPGSRFKAGHCIELPFVFGTLDAWPGAGMLEGGDPRQMSALSTTMRRLWSGFVRDGDPGMGWPLYDPRRRATMVFGDVVGVMGT